MKLFTPPYREEAVRLAGRALIYRYSVSSSVWKTAGVWHNQESPYDGDLEAADIVLTRSGPVVVDDATAAELVAAGIGTVEDI